MTFTFLSPSLTTNVVTTMFVVMPNQPRVRLLRRAGTIPHAGPVEYVLLECFGEWDPEELRPSKSCDVELRKEPGHRAAWRNRDGYALVLTPEFMLSNT